MVVSAIFAARVRPDAVAVGVDEHDGLRWVPADEAPALAIWPSYAESIRRVREMLLDPAREPWFRLDADGRADRPPPDRPDLDRAVAQGGRLPAAAAGTWRVRLDAPPRRRLPDHRERPARAGAEVRGRRRDDP